ncbi:hypothetical protein LTS10_011983 [Elasticomyces elasticus]|nr:hypothetical protein LTS10_011983 [Elasticomyces elasticus]
MALTTLDAEIINKLFLAKMVEYMHSGELGRDYEEAKKAEEKFGRMRAQQVFVTKDGISPCEDVAEKVAEISTAHREELQQAAPDASIQRSVTKAAPTNAQEIGSGKVVKSIELENTPSKLEIQRLVEDAHEEAPFSQWLKARRERMRIGFRDSL